MQAIDAKIELDYFEGMWQGKAVCFDRVFRGHRFTVEECRALCDGKLIQVHNLYRRGVHYAVEGRLFESSEIRDGKQLLQFRSEHIVPNNPDYEFGRSTGIYDLLEPQQHTAEMNWDNDPSLPPVILDDRDLQGISFDVPVSDVQMPLSGMSFQQQVAHMLDNVGNHLVDTYQHSLLQEQDQEFDDKQPPDFLTIGSLNDFQNDIQQAFVDEVQTHDRWVNPFETEDDMQDTDLFAVMSDEDDPLAGISEEDLALLDIHEDQQSSQSVTADTMNAIVKKTDMERLADYFDDSEFDEDIGEDAAYCIRHSLDDA